MPVRPRLRHARPFLLATCALALTLANARGAHALPTETVLYNFDVLPSGLNPQAALTAGPNGVYYGTTDAGGASGNGTVFELTPPAAGQKAWTQKVIYSFTGAPDGAIPSSGMLLGKDGSLYGVTGIGGAQGGGVVFQLTPPAAGQSAWTETVLFSFNGGSNGNGPYGTLVQDANGVLYGTTSGGGNATGSGVVFSLTPPAGGGSWTQNVLYTFQGGTDGASPANGIYQDSTGALYGMTAVGGANGAGTIWRLTPAASGSPWPKTILYNFLGQPDGAFPVGALVGGPNGILYGATDAGGASGWGTVFALTPPPSGKTKWTETALYSFTGGGDGGAPDSTPVLAADGTLYGTTNAGGSAGSGAAYTLTPPAAGQKAWTEAAIASFTGPNGTSPIGLTLNASGALFGTTYYGGTKGEGGGTIFTLTPPAQGGSAWTQAELCQFAAVGKQAASPIGALLMSKTGTIYGSANQGGATNHGAVYALTPPAKGGTAWQGTVLHSFNGTDGASATGNLVQAKSGVLYGITTTGGTKGASGYGTAYALIPPAAGKTDWREKLLHAFTGVASGDGAFPGSGMIEDSTGALYGTTSAGGTATSGNNVGNGIVFKLTPPPKGQAAWTETILYSFSGPDGATPDGTLLLGKNGVLYGTTYVGGSAGEGAVFQLTPPAAQGGSWTESVLYSFNASVNNDGAIPGAEQLVQDSTGALYGTTSQGGANGDGTVFKLTPPTGAQTAWTESILHSFTGADGTGPFVGLLASKSGTFYGVTQQGGAFQYGTIFKLTPSAGGTVWTATDLHDFNPAYHRDGADAASALIKDAKGNLYGATATGGFSNVGVMFEVRP